MAKSKVSLNPTPIQSATTRRNSYRRWLRWWKLLLVDIETIALHRYLYREMMAMVDGNPALKVPSAFYDWMQLAYVSQMSLAIRRLADWDKRTVSFVGLMTEIIQHPEVISRRRYVGLYRSMARRQLGLKSFARFASKSAEHIDPTIVLNRRREFLAAHRRLRTFVNKHVAHRSRYPMRRLPTYTELDGCIDLLEKLAKEFSLLLDATGLAQVVPVIQYDWKKPFRVAWI